MGCHKWGHAINGADSIAINGVAINGVRLHYSYSEKPLTLRPRAGSQPK